MTLNWVKGNMQPQSQKTKMWRYTADGFLKFHEITGEPVKWRTSGSVEETYESLMQEIEQFLHKCFEKKTVYAGKKQKKWSNAKGVVRKVLQEEAKRGRIQRKTIQFLQYYLQF